jgi:hypothetical protein
MRPAFRLIFAPLNNRDKALREKGFVLDGSTLGRTIRLDPRSPNILDTLVHEMAHMDHPSWPEEEVRTYTKKRMKKMGWPEKARLLKLLGFAELEGGR